MPTKCGAVVRVDTGRPDKKDGWSISCEGDCDHDAPCERHTVEKTEGKRRISETWCSCSKSETEPETCHLVLRQIFEGENLVKECVECRGSCPKNDKLNPGPCQLRLYAKVMNEPEEGECADIHATYWVRFTYRCQCHV
jgi:hypothetical protein